MTSSTFSSRNSADLKRLRASLEELRARFSGEVLFSDPLQFPHRYDDPLDREASALISAFFAYGRVQNIVAFLERVHGFLGGSPREGLLKRKKWKGPGYRFQTTGDVGDFLLALGKIYDENESLESLFEKGEGNCEDKLAFLAGQIRRNFRPVTRGLDHLVSQPSGTSAVKRWRLFLRWVVREDDGLDLGLWTAVKPEQLIIPLDTHIARTAMELGLATRRTKDLKFAVEVTETLKLICPEDPLKYDFALVRPGILKNLLYNGVRRRR